MRLQWPRFLTKPEPEVPRTPARPGPLHGPGSLHGQDWFHRVFDKENVRTRFYPKHESCRAFQYLNFREDKLFRISLDFKMKMEFKNGTGIMENPNIARRSVPTGFNSTLDTAFTNEVSSLAATPDTRWRAMSGGL
ncbi:hypothetical protein TIFTF001_052417 [Ficus carica]|uniref:Uncharacterized protein n=1 Tax=Ficus carica TaxID=3494 RepID=A0AA88JF14_FICCA|nr:hypothetical protein TIFTF001_052416 [Ficus carica]GMN74629.1 hypothetical protein TIFTF001_052417 [Ficus carica]